MLKNLYKRAFDIRDGEITISFFMQLYIFLVITVLLIVKPTVNALFLSALGAERLPYGFLLVAVVAILSSYFYNKAVRKYSFKKLATVSLLSFGLFFVLLSLALHFRFLEVWVLYIYYVLIALFAVMITSQFWILANMVYNAREAKRLFGFIGAGAIAGGIFGGYLTTWISGSFGNKVSIAIAALLLISCIPILFHIWRLKLRQISVFTRRKRLHEEEAPDRHAFQLIAQSPHLRLIAAILGISVIVAKLVDFQFSDFAHRAIPDSDELASFLGFWFSTFNVIALVLQLFLTNRVLNYLGVTSTLLVLPLGIALVCLAFLYAPELWILIILKGMDGGLKQSLNKAATELAILPVPHAVKNQAKSFIDIVVDSIATGIAGFLLIFVIRGMALDTQFVTLIILVLLFVWILFIYKLRETYFASFRDNLLALLQSDGENLKGNRNIRTLAKARQILRKGNAKAIHTLLERISPTQLTALQPEVEALLDHTDDAIKIEAIEQLYQFKRGTAVAKVTPYIAAENSELAQAAMEYKLFHTEAEESEVFGSYLNHENPKIAAIALKCLAKASRRNKRQAERFRLDERIKDKLQSLTTPQGLEQPQETAELLVTVAHAGNPDYYYYLAIHFRNKNTFIVQHALEAAGITADPRFLGDILQHLELKPFRKHAIKALIEYGPEVSNYLLQLENQELLTNNVRRYIPKVVAAFHTKSSTKMLYKFLRSKDANIRQQAAKQLRKLGTTSTQFVVNRGAVTKALLKETQRYSEGIQMARKFEWYINATEDNGTHSDADTELQLARQQLVQLLEEQAETTLEAIFELLRLRYNHEDISTVYLGLKSPDEEARINALEFLDNLVHVRIKHQIMPLIEHALMRHQDEDEQTPLDPRSEDDMIVHLFKSRGKRMKLALLHLISRKRTNVHDSILKKMTKHRDPEVRRLALSVVTA